ncbi:hypothetical protein FXO38_30550 [Capsicum annuum]|uniref:Uncharacterized protein n=1 Tax=Capsicum annuum TaxID=4072 RepID=A0A2G3A098_CAPAN|nr:hypothetical protein FXO37_32217 [Capsicum annuum]KAF3623870.1 hypothetical protein FXO38_30550 [Capsicum annuum]PHT87638.1 hypothetical protein T459_09744 [Capsicum annuum]
MFVVIGVVVLIVAPLQNYAFGVVGAKLIQRIHSMTLLSWYTTRSVGLMTLQTQGKFHKVRECINGFLNSPNFLMLKFIKDSGAIGARLSSDASTIRNMVGDALATIVQNMCISNNSPKHVHCVTDLVITLIANWILALEKEQNYFCNMSSKNVTPTVCFRLRRWRSAEKRGDKQI